MADTMRAMAVTRDGVSLVEIPKPMPGPGEVRVRVVASSINPSEEKVASGDFVGRFLHAKVSPLVLGWDFAGDIDALGEGVTDVQPGAAVWGHLAFTPSQKQGSFSEYVTVPRAEVAAKPTNVPYHVAGAAATVSMTGLQSLRDNGRLREGGRAMVIGAGGGIGSVAVGIGKRLGGHVTAVCSTKDVERVRALGADEVIDRRKTDPLGAVSAFDVILDTPAVHSFARCAKSLRPGGTYVTTLPDAALITGMFKALFGSKRCRFVQVVSRQEDLELVGGWLEDGLDVTIDSRHDIASLDAALKRQTDGARIGRVVVDVDGRWPS